jgi:hypothetical protein
MVLARPGEYKAPGPYGKRIEGKRIGGKKRG